MSMEPGQWRPLGCLTRRQSGIVIPQNYKGTDFEDFDKVPGGHAVAMEYKATDKPSDFDIGNVQPLTETEGPVKEDNREEEEGDENEDRRKTMTTTVKRRMVPRRRKLGELLLVHCLVYNRTAPSYHLGFCPLWSPR
ncbi:hypothetical protein AAF712_016520 [Marasmius tenuissimus]|uniref:Uncharacterized protein n=1 Tax=Marasmius tenuissimus TaxID=585030 RepID=A0ABR2Z5I1_9AGAR